MLPALAPVYGCSKTLKAHTHQVRSTGADPSTVQEPICGARTRGAGPRTLQGRASQVRNGVDPDPYASQSAKHGQWALHQEPRGSDVHTSTKRFVLRVALFQRWNMCDSSATLSSLSVVVERRRRRGYCKYVASHATETENLILEMVHNV